MQRNLVYLINPIAGAGRATAVKDLISEATSAQKIPFQILSTDAAGQYGPLALQLQQSGVTDVIICGGDGTINSVASQFKDTGINIGIIPMGSGNGLALAAGISRELPRALETIFSGRASEVDAFLINGKFSCMLCGIGFDAQVAHDFALQKTRGLQTYIRLSAMNYLKARPYHFVIESAKTRIEAEAYFVCIANSNQFGNNFTIAPRASIDDGLLDIVIVKRMSKLMIPFSVMSHAAGNNALQQLDENISQNNIIYFQTGELTIQNPGSAPLHIDGDPVPTDSFFQVKIIQRAFRLLH